MVSLPVMQKHGTEIAPELFLDQFLKNRNAGNQAGHDSGASGQ